MKAARHIPIDGRRTKSNTSDIEQRDTKSLELFPR
jgi:hypothetical protein